MKRVFLVCALLVGISFSQEKTYNIHLPAEKKDITLTPGILSSDHIHRMMEKREISPYVAWMILLGNFPQDYNAFLSTK